MTKIGIIGMGKWGLNHLKTLSSIKGCELIGFADVNPDMKKLADEYRVNYFRDYHALLKHVDAVTVAVPTDLHYKVVKECLNSGKHVLVEKPVTQSSEQAKELVSLAKQKKLILSVGYLFRFNASVKRLKEIMKSTGRIHYITSRYIHSSVPPRKDSGVILNLGIHMIDVLNFILEDRPETVFCRKNNILSEKLEDSAILLLNYRNFSASIEVSCCHPLKERDMWIIGSDEKIYIDFLNQKLIRYPINVSYKGNVRKEEINERINRNDPLMEELTYFCRCVKEKNIKDFELIENIGKEEIYSTKICELCIMSAENGKEMRL